MELIHRCKKKELENELAEKGFYEAKEKGGYLHFCTWNSWPLIAGKQPAFDPEEDVFLVVSSADGKLDIRFEADERGIEFPHVYGKIFPESILRLDPLDHFERTCILMNTSMIDEAWCRPALLRVFHAGQVVCVLAFSFFGDTKTLQQWNQQYKKGQGIWYRANTDVFAPYGIKEKDVHWVNYFTDSKEQMLNAIVNSDVLLLPGGAPDLAMKRIREKKLKRVLRDYQGVVLGYSAGAMMQLDDYHITPDEDYPDFGWQKGLGYLKDLDIEVHYRALQHQKRSIERAQSEKNLPVLAIYEKGGVLIGTDGKQQFFGQVDVFERPEPVRSEAEKRAFETGTAAKHQQKTKGKSG